MSIPPSTPHVTPSLQKQNSILVAGKKERKSHSLPKGGNLTWFWPFVVVACFDCSLEAFVPQEDKLKRTSESLCTPCKTSDQRGILPRVSALLTHTNSRRGNRTRGSSLCLPFTDGRQSPEEREAQRGTAISYSPVTLDSKSREEKGEKGREGGRKTDKGKEGRKRSPKIP